MSITLTEIQTDALMEMINIGMGRAARILSEMVGAQVFLQVPQVKVFEPEQAREELRLLDQDRVSAVTLGYEGILSGNSLLCFPPESAARLTNFLVGAEGDDELLSMDALKMATLTEVGNIMLNGVVGSISNLLETHLSYRVPVYEEGPAQDLLGEHLGNQAEVVVLAETRLEVKALHITGETILLLEADSFATILRAINKLVARYQEV